MLKLSLYFIVSITVVQSLWCWNSVEAWDNAEFEMFDLVEEMGIRNNFYDFLGVPQDAEDKAIRSAYRKKYAEQLSVANPVEYAAGPEFQKLAGVYNAIKNKERRESYNKVLVEGLPNWRHPMFYFRRARKLALWQVTVIILGIVSLGQYLAGWASYFEKRFTMKEIIEARLKKTSRTKKGQKEGPSAAELEAEYEKHMPKPSNQQTHCSTCRIAFPKQKIQCLGVEALQPELLKCNQAGCSAIVGSEDDLKNHVQYSCNYIEVSLCRLLGFDGCNVKLQPGKIDETIFDHLSVAHGILITYYNPLFGCDYLNSKVTSHLILCESQKFFVILRLLEIGGRKYIRVFGFGDREGIQRVMVVIETRYSRSALAFGSSGPQTLGSMTMLPLASITDENAEDYMRANTFDIGPLPFVLFEDLMFQFASKDKIHENCIKENWDIVTDNFLLDQAILRGQDAIEEGSQ